MPSSNEVPITASLIPERRPHFDGRHGWAEINERNDGIASKSLPVGKSTADGVRWPAEFDGIIREKGVAVAMRDGGHLAVDIYRPDASGKFLALLAFGVHSKELQGDEYPKHFPPQPSWSSLWLGHMEAGDITLLAAVVCR